MFKNKRNLLLLLILAAFLFSVMFNFYSFWVLIASILGYSGYLYAKKKRLNGALGFFLGFFFNILGFIIIAAVSSHDVQDNDLHSKLYRLSRIKFYLVLLIFTLLFSFLSFLFIKSLGDTCTGMECLGMAPLVIGSFFILFSLLIIINLILIIIYEIINKSNRRNRFLALTYVLILFAGFSYGVFGDLFFVNHLIVEPRANNKIERDIKSFIENKDMDGCLLYIRELPPSKYSGPHKTGLRNKCALQMALLYKDLSMCSHFLQDYDSRDLGYCYTQVLSSLHKIPDMNLYNRYFKQAEFFCEDLQNDRPPCLFIINNPTFYILNSQEMLSFCQSIDDHEIQLKCVNRYSTISQEKILSFCDSIKISARATCVERLLKLINFKTKYLNE
jgi:hypothetical protein